MSDSNAFKFGDYVILLDRRERQYMFILEKGGSFESHIGNLDHEDLCGLKEGTWIRTKTGHWMVAFRPTKAEYMLNMKRIATVVYPKDIGAVLTYGNLYPGAEVLEAGSGSGALTIALSDAVGSAGHVYSYDVRQDMSNMAKSNLNGIAKHPDNVQFFTEDIANNIYQSELDCAILDMP